MPYKQVYFDAPRALDLKVFKLPPAGFEINSWANYKEASMHIHQWVKLQESDKKLNPQVYHFCHFCDGWIAGHPNQYKESNLGPLCGRKGTAYHCLRCGHEIGFCGMVS